MTDWIEKEGDEEREKFKRKQNKNNGHSREGAYPARSGHVLDDFGVELDIALFIVVDAELDGALQAHLTVWFEGAHPHRPPSTRRNMRKNNFKKKGNHRRKTREENTK